MAKKFFTNLALLALAFFSSNFALAEDSTLVSTKAGNVSISYKTDFSRENQRETVDANATTSTGTKQTLTISKSLSSNVVLGMDVTYSTLNQVADELVPPFPERLSLKRNNIEANAFTEIKRFGLTFRPSVRFGIDDYQLNRPDIPGYAVGGPAGMARSQSDGFHTGADLEISTILPVTQSLFLRPIADLDYSYLTVDPFTETGNVAGLAAFDRVYDQRVTLQMGLGAATRLPLGENAWLTPYVQARYRHNFNTTPIATTAMPLNPLFPAQNAVLATAEEADGLIIDAGAFLAGDGNWEIMANYEGKFFPSLTGQTFSGRLKFNF